MEIRGFVNSERVEKTKQWKQLFISLHMGDIFSPLVCDHSVLHRRLFPSLVYLLRFLTFSTEI